MRIENNLSQIGNNINKIAEDISKQGINNLEENFVDLIENKNLFTANIKVIQAEDEMLGSLLDMKA